MQLLAGYLQLTTLLIYNKLQMLTFIPCFDILYIVRVKQLQSIVYKNIEIYLVINNVDVYNVARKGFKCVYK